MRAIYTNVDREFTPSEATHVAGVSGALQRDWRRRGILPENADGKWTRFTLTAVIRMCVMKTFSDAGFSVSYVADFADMAILPTLSMLYEIPGAVAFEGDNVSDRMKKLHVQNAVVGANGRFLVMTRNSTTGDPVISRWTDLDRLDDHLAEQGAAHCTILDCYLLADAIAGRAGLPLMRVEVERIPDDA